MRKKELQKNCPLVRKYSRLLTPVNIFIDQLHTTVWWIHASNYNISAMTLPKKLVIKLAKVYWKKLIENITSSKL